MTKPDGTNHDDGFFDGHERPAKTTAVDDARNMECSRCHSTVSVEYGLEWGGGDICHQCAYTKVAELEAQLRQEREASEWLRARVEERERGNIVLSEMLSALAHVNELEMEKVAQLQITISTLTAALEAYRQSHTYCATPADEVDRLYMFTPCEECIQAIAALANITPKPEDV